MTTQEQILGFYATPSVMTSFGKHAGLAKGLPNDIAVLIKIVQGLIVHEFVASSFYGIELPNERRSESHIRPVEEMLDRILAMDDRPLAVTRPPEKRLVGVCRHFMVLLLAFLRAKGIAARGHCGFGTYFNPGYFEDHVVCECWRAQEARWVLVDPQFDEVWREKLKIDHDVLDVPRDRFVIAADAWAKCRAGKADPAKFGTVRGNLRGLWFVATNLVHEVAGLNKVELLRWDSWGAIPRPDEPLQDDQLAFFDELAALTQEPDDSFEERRRRYESDARLHVPPNVFNALLNRAEAVAAAV
jgi:hypothetical protein